MDYVQAFNAGEPAMRGFLESHAASNSPIDARMERYRDIRERLGTLTFKNFLERNAAGLSTSMIASKINDVTLIFMLTNANPPKLEGIRIERKDSGQQSPGNNGPPIDEAAALKEIEAIVARHAQADDFSGVALVAKRDKTVFEKATGLANVTHHVPNTMETIFNYGSIGKVFTKLAIQKLQAQGKLSLSDTIGKFLPDYPNQQARSAVTISQLIEMRSGIGDFFGDEFAAKPKNEIRTLSDYMPLFASKPLAFQPGAKEAYSNGGYVVLGRIIEKITGMSYYDYVAKEIFLPFGMTDTGYFEPDSPRERIATGYTKRDGSAPGARA